MPLIAYCAGQLASMLVTRGLVAGFAGLVLSAAVLGWHHVTAWLGIGWWWSVLPIPLAFLLATWLRAPNWLFERGGWRGWWPVVVVLVTIMLGIPAVVAVVRVFEIPGGISRFSLERLTSSN